MGFTVRFMLGMVLVLLCSWPIQTKQLNRQVRQATNNGGTNTTDKLQKIEIETTQRTVTNLKEENNNKPKTESSTEDKQNSVVDKLEKSETLTVTDQPVVKNTREEIARSIDIEKYVSKEFHSKNNVYTLPVSPDTDKYINPDFDFHHATTRKHETHSELFDFDSELTTPKSLIFDNRFKEAVESVDQKLEHIDEADEASDESASKENVNIEKLHEQTKKNDTKADLDYINYKNIVSNDTGSKNALQKDLVVEAGTNLKFQSSYNHTTVIDEDDSGNNTIVKQPDDETKAETSTLSNIIQVQDLENAESSASRSMVLHPRKIIGPTKPPSNNSSHISILSNKIETETVKAINPVLTTERSKGEKEVYPTISYKEGPVSVSKRVVVVAEVTSTQPPVISNEINKTAEQLVHENQVIPIHVATIQPTPEPKPVTVTPSIQETVVTVTPVSVITTTETSTEEPTTTMINFVENESATQNQQTILPQHEKETTTEVKSTEILSTIKPVESETMTSILTEISTTPWERVTTETATAEVETTMNPETLTTVNSETLTTVNPETLTTVNTETLTTGNPETLTTGNPETLTTGNPEKLTTIQPQVLKQETTTFPSTFQADSTAETVTTEATVIEFTTTEPSYTTTTIVKTNSPETVTTESSIRTSKQMIFKENTVTEPAEITTTEMPTTEAIATEMERSTEALIRTTTEGVTESATNSETTETKKEEHETTTSPYVVTNCINLVPEFKLAEQTDSTAEDNTVTDNTATSDYYEHTDSPEHKSGTIAAITISSIGAVCLVLLAGLLVIMRKRQKRFNYGQRCRPVSLDDYSMDNVSVYNSVRRKGMIRGSKRSYGNPAFEDPVSVTHPLNFPSLGKFANNLEEIRDEFEEIPQITARTNELPEGCDTKNRYANVIPLPETRVFLNLIEGYPNSDYINANYVTGPKNTKGYYIACQAPMPNTVDDFWRMIWEQQCKVVLMLTHLFENGVEKCFDYLPPSEVLDCHRLFGDFQITLKKREVKDKYIISSLQLKNMVSNSWREVTHFWYLGWPEKGVPTEANSLIAFLIEARSYMKSASLDRKDATNGSLTNGMTKNELNPVVVHCSPGTGRTGVVIACDIAIREFEQTRLVDVPRIVYKIRRDRASAVQTKEQYAFIYKVINLYATKLTGGALDSL